jgi:hypothetical protein
MHVRLANPALPQIELPISRPALPTATYLDRCRRAYEAAGTEWLVVYSDREHNANLLFLTGFDPRFEEALFLIGPSGKHVLITGNESIEYAVLAGLNGMELALCQTFSLLGQTRAKAPSLERVLQQAGIRPGTSIGVVGWKYLEPEQWDLNGASFFVPAFVVASLARVAGSPEALLDATHVLMHYEKGLRAYADADTIAELEWAASRASVAVWSIVSDAKVGDTELAAASRMGYAGEPLSCHVMMSSGDERAPVVGLASPSSRILQRGNGVTTAVGYWGGLSSRAGLLGNTDGRFVETAAAYFRGLVAWYETSDIGVRGDTIHQAVAEMLAKGDLVPALNPGHLVSYDEWSNTPIRPDGAGTIASGMPFQVDIIPGPLSRGQALNCEDTVVFADEALRQDLASRHPEVWARIVARRKFMTESIGIDLKTTILPLSNIPLCLPPDWTKANEILVCAG